jgi:probable rRNA maturation factor
VTVMIEIAVETEGWNAEPGIDDLIRRSAVAAAEACGCAAGEIGVTLTGDEAIRALNRDHRGFDKPTNVLSFPLAAPGESGPRLLGDVVLALETVLREAQAERKSFAHHAAHLVVHGVLHLFGDDHETDEEAERMEAREIEILAGLGISDPYAAQDGRAAVA